LFRKIYYLIIFICVFSSSALTAESSPFLQYQISKQESLYHLLKVLSYNPIFGDEGALKNHDFFKSWRVQSTRDPSNIQSVDSSA